MYAPQKSTNSRKMAKRIAVVSQWKAFKMKFEVLDIDYDHRVSCYALNAKADYEWYLEKTTGAEHNLEIQRSIISGRKTYETLRADLKRGCILPPIVLAAQQVALPNAQKENPKEVFTEISDAEKESLQGTLSGHNANFIQIIDGLQRTNAIRSVLSELGEEERKTFLQRPIRLEIWLNIQFFALAYRMLLLNAGQKPMSMKHQIEILADSMRVEFQAIPNLEIIRGIEKRRRTQPGQFQLATLSSAFQAWLQKQANIDLKSAVTEQLLADEAVETLGAGLNPANHPTGGDFANFVEWLVRLDVALGEPNKKFLGAETTVMAFSAALAEMLSNENLQERANEAMAKLVKDAESGDPSEVLGLELFEDLRAAIDPKKENVGEGTRNLVQRAIKEYVFSSGQKPMKDCWITADSMR